VGEPLTEEDGRDRGPWSILLLFCRLSLTAFGGPVAHVALLRQELVGRRAWLSDEAFLDLVAVTNLLPGPNSTEVAMELGRRRAGRAGLLAAGAGFILPAALVALAAAWLYVAAGDLPPIQAALAGVKPVVIAIVALAVGALGRSLTRDPWLIVLATACLAAYVAGVSELALLATGAIVGVGLRALRSAADRARPVLVLGVPALPAVLSALGAGAGGTASALAPAGVAGLVGIFSVFLKAGALLFGSGYVLLAFLRSDLVTELGWLTDRQLLDAIAIGQATPGPLFTTATFIGYVLAGLPGAIVATVAIFLPAFLFVLLVDPIVRGLRARPWTGAALDGLVAAALGLMAGVAIVLGRDALAPAGDGSLDPVAVVAFAASLLLLASGRAGPTLLIGAGALLGLGRLLLGLA
jgi:chromate transporter